MSTAFTLALGVSIPGVNAQDEDNLVALATERCELPGLTVAPPAPWYSVPIESKEVDGCQMIWEEGDQFMGILRLVAFDAGRLAGEAVAWEDFVVAFESEVYKNMGIKLGAPIWKRDVVPVSGPGLGNGKAIGLNASLEGVAHQNEVHFMLFDSPTHKYSISVLTPAKGASEEVYMANTGAMGTVMRTLQPR